MQAKVRWEGNFPQMSQKEVGR